jgi:hypothetical protein
MPDFRPLLKEKARIHDGSRYEGDLCWSEAEADDLVSQCPEGTILQVHVSPTQPEQSVLRV